MSTPQKELLRGNDEYLLRFYPNCLSYGYPRTSDIGYEVTPNKLASVTFVKTTYHRGHFLFYARG
jgi:hypothetical protein